MGLVTEKTEGGAASVTAGSGCSNDDLKTQSLSVFGSALSFSASFLDPPPWHPAGLGSHPLYCQETGKRYFCSGPECGHLASREPRCALHPRVPARVQLEHACRVPGALGQHRVAPQEMIPREGGWALGIMRDWGSPVRGEKETETPMSQDARVMKAREGGVQSP